MTDNKEKFNKIQNGLPDLELLGRFMTNSSATEIEKSNALFDIAVKNNDPSDPIERLHILDKALNNIYYVAIREGYILDPGRTMDMLSYYTLIEPIQLRADYLGWICSHYYKGLTETAMDYYVKEERYEEAIPYRNALLITTMPGKKG